MSCSWPDAPRSADGAMPAPLAAAARGDEAVARWITAQMSSGITDTDTAFFRRKLGVFPGYDRTFDRRLCRFTAECKNERNPYPYLRSRAGSGIRLHFSFGLSKRRMQKRDLRLCRGGLYAHRPIAKSACGHAVREEVVLRYVLQWLHETIRPRRRALVYARDGCALPAVSPIDRSRPHRTWQRIAGSERVGLARCTQTRDCHCGHQGVDRVGATSAAVTR
jgi:hypothetical protein